MLPYIITLLIYMLSFPLAFALTASREISLFFTLIIVGLTLYHYKESFSFKFKFDGLAIIIGAIIFILWVALNPYQDSTKTYSMVSIILKLIIGIIYAPIIEEFFTRFFLLRWVISKDWKDVPLGKYTLSSFIFTVLFFGFAHSMWVAGLITGILLNLLFYKRKNIESCIIAHSAANLILGVYVVINQAWYFW